MDRPRHRLNAYWPVEVRLQVEHGPRPSAYPHLGPLLA